VLGVTAFVPGRLFLFGGEVDPSSQGHEGAGSFAGDTLTLDLHAAEKGWQSVTGLSGTPSPRYDDAQ
jgi:hypothetical protein